MNWKYIYLRFILLVRSYFTRFRLCNNCHVPLLEKEGYNCSECNEYLIRKSIKDTYQIFKNSLINLDQLSNKLKTPGKVDNCEFYNCVVTGSNIVEIENCKFVNGVIN